MGRFARADRQLLADYCPWREAETGQKRSLGVSTKLGAIQLAHADGRNGSFSVGRG